MLLCYALRTRTRNNAQIGYIVYSSSCTYNHLYNWRRYFSVLVSKTLTRSVAMATCDDDMCVCVCVLTNDERVPHRRSPANGDINVTRSPDTHALITHMHIHMHVVVLHSPSTYICIHICTAQHAICSSLNTTMLTFAECRRRRRWRTCRAMMRTTRRQSVGAAESSSATSKVQQRTSTNANATNRSDVRPYR